MAVLSSLLRSVQGGQLYTPGTTASTDNWRKGRSPGFRTVSPCCLGTAIGPGIRPGSCSYKSASAHPSSPKLRIANEKGNFVCPDSSQTTRLVLHASNTLFIALGIYSSGTSGSTTCLIVYCPESCASLCSVVLPPSSCSNWTPSATTICLYQAYPVVSGASRNNFLPLSVL